MQLGAEDIPIHIPSYLTEDRKPASWLNWRSSKNLSASTSLNRTLSRFRETGGTDSRSMTSRPANWTTSRASSCPILAISPRRTTLSSPPTLVFAPIVAISTYRGVLEDEGIEAEVIEQNLKDIREQRISTMFFLPAAGVLAEDHMAKMDEAYTVPASLFQVADPPTRLFSLYDVAFYLFTFKLSYHFCRLHEKVDRTPG